MLIFCDQMVKNWIFVEMNSNIKMCVINKTVEMLGEVEVEERNILMRIEITRTNKGFQMAILCNINLNETCARVVPIYRRQRL